MQCYDNNAENIQMIIMSIEMAKQKPEVSTDLNRKVLLTPFKNTA